MVTDSGTADEEEPSPVLLRTRCLRAPGGNVDKLSTGYWVANQAANPPLVAGRSSPSVNGLYTEAEPALRSVTPALAERSWCNSNSPLDAAPSSVTKQHVLGNLAPPDDAIGALLERERAELEILFIEWVSRLSGIREDFDRRQKEFIERAVAACAAGFAGGEPLLWPWAVKGVQAPANGTAHPLPPPPKSALVPHPPHEDEVHSWSQDDLEIAAWQHPSRGPDPLLPSAVGSFSSIVPSPVAQKPVGRQTPKDADVGVLSSHDAPELVSSLAAPIVPGCVEEHINDNQSEISISELGEVPKSSTPSSPQTPKIGDAPNLCSVDSDVERGVKASSNEKDDEVPPPETEKESLAPSCPSTEKKSPKDRENFRPLAHYQARGRTSEQTVVFENDDLPGPLGVLQMKLRACTKSVPFTMMAALVIFINAIYIGYAEQMALQVITQNRVLGPIDRAIKDYAEQVFCIFFTGEMVLRLIAEPVSFVRGAEWSWNLFDVALIVNCLTEALLSEAGGIPNLTVVRILRICRMFRILRIIRVMRFFRTLRLMVSSIMASMVSLLWVFMLLLFTFYVWSIFFLHAVYEYAKEEHEQQADMNGTLLKDLVSLFPTVDQSIITLFMAISGGRDWKEVADPLNRLDRGYGTAFMAYIFFVVFGMLNVITSAFVDILQQVSKRDKDLVIEEEMKRTLQYIDGVKQIFIEADADNSATLSWEELVAHMQDARMQAYLSSLELDASQARALFVLLDVDESGEVCVDEFVKGCMRLKGSARSMDVNMLLYESEKMIYQFCCFKEYAEEQFDKIMQKIDPAEFKKKSANGPERKAKRTTTQGSNMAASRLEVAANMINRLTTMGTQDLCAKPDGAPIGAPPHPP